jgi:Type I restriction enzyme R protein N terminus (HSDR_N)
MAQEEILPLYDLTVRVEGSTRYLFDPIRKKEVAGTREEYVRQCLIKFLADEKKVPTGLMSVEKGTRFNTMLRRYDLVIYDRNGAPILCAECKAPEIKIREETFRQLAVYNANLNVKYLLITNGKTLLSFVISESGEYVQVARLPIFDKW